ncbi:DUF4190 domain-containing protein [Psychrobacillus sp. OK032]|uniref:DUF4190 domain-containing protein n=1 Tax=Psychrobacillus sp. OK032 TaxID=1884358 RepID=UPI0008BA5CC9|nr:DUF4190 domain-containing protein [Psychrobacillus sp. OK032]SES44652.1 protein of unknown function [Psychrobacillus sp. OK032]
MDAQETQEIKVTNGKAMGSLIIGIVSILGIILLEGGLILSVLGLLLGMIGLRETKQLKQNGSKFAIAGIICNCLGVFSLFFKVL